jgi:hypothetical protein
VSIVVFFVFVAVVALATVSLSYGLSPVDERTVSRRCQMPYETRRKRKVRRQRMKCRFEG